MPQSDHPFGNSVRRHILGNVPQDRAFKWLRDFNRYETVRRIQIVLATLIDDPKVAISRGIVIWKNTINLVQLEGNGVLRIINTDCESWSSSLDSFFNHQSRYRFRRISFLPIPWPSYQCNSAGRTRPLLNRTRAIPFNFLQRRPPYALFKRARSRMEGPAENR
jgi:hypothetical protein